MPLLRHFLLQVLSPPITLLARDIYQDLSMLFLKGQIKSVYLKNLNPYILIPHVYVLIPLHQIPGYNSVKKNCLGYQIIKGANLAIAGCRSARRPSSQLWVTYGVRQP